MPRWLALAFTALGLGLATALERERRLARRVADLDRQRRAWPPASWE